MNAPVAILLVSLTSGGPSFQQVAEKTQPSKTITKKVVLDGVAMTASIQEESTAGTPSVLTVHVENQGKDKLKWISRGTKYDDVRLSLQDSRGMPVPFTSFGKLVDGSREGSGMLVFLDVGKSRTLNLNLTRVFDITMPGEYSVTVEGHFGKVRPQGGGVYPKIEKLRFRIIDEPR